MAIQQLLLGAGGGAKKTYVEDVFNTNVKSFYGNTTIVNNIDLSNEGGLVWEKVRDSAVAYNLCDTENGVNKFLRTNGNHALTDSSYVVTSFNNNGYTFNDGYGGAHDHVSWTFRKAPGFFDIVTYTGNGNSSQTISHSLGSIPGFMLVKSTTNTEDWYAYHRKLDSGNNPATHYIQLNNNSPQYDDVGIWNDYTPTASDFQVGTDCNTNGQTYVVYLFAGGESTAATARSVEFNGTDDVLTIGSSSDFELGTGDYTIEFWTYTSDRTGRGPLTIGGYNTAGGAQYWMGSDGKHRWYWHDGTSRSIDGPAVKRNQWEHCAVTRTSGKTQIFVNGVAYGSDTNNSSTNPIGSNGQNTLIIGCERKDDGTQAGHFPGKISNLRIIKGTSLYTGSFRPPTKPLTNVSGTVLLCCNQSTTTGSTVTPGTISDPNTSTASINSPFDDPAGLVFGDNEEGLIKCGSYNSDVSANIEVEVGWEPQYVLIKNADSSGDAYSNWMIYDSMRGVVHNGKDVSLMANRTEEEKGGTYNLDDQFIEFNPTGFKVIAGWSAVSQINKDYIYVAIRRPDGYVGKPANAGTDVFAMDTGNSSGIIPAMDSGFPVDWAMVTKPASTHDKWSYARLLQNSYMVINGSGTEGNSSAGTFDSNVGFYEGSNYDSAYQSWMFKRHAGFDVVTYKGTSVGPRSIPHSLGKTPGMIMVKRRNSSEDWTVYHSGMGDGNPAINYHMQWNNNNARYDGSTTHYVWGGVAPTSTHFSVGGSTNPDRTNNINDSYVALLFANVSGISKCGHYTGDSSQVRTIETGFQPRFIIMKRTDSTSSWYVLDTTRGWATLAGDNDKLLMLNNDTAQSDYEFGDPVSNGFRLNGNVLGNGDNQKWIYYAHA